MDMRKIGLIGLPTDINSSYLRGCGHAPLRVRELMSADMMNKISESGLHLGTDFEFVDHGDVQLAGSDEQFLIERAVVETIEAGFTPLCIGGDHSVTYPIMKAIARRFGPVSILHIDAHPDLYKNYQDNRFSHASPFARIMEDGLASRLVQVGIRTLTRHQKEQAQRYRVEMITMAEIEAVSTLTFNGPLYISIDLDGLDPSQAPGVSHHEPGGLDIRQLLSIFHTIKTPVIGCDIVEYNPERDLNDMTCAVVLKLIKELSALMASSILYDHS